MPDKPPVNQGDDISGVVYEVGEGVTEFKKGDRVAAFHEMMSPHGSYAEYALSWAHTTFPLPPNVSFEGKLYLLDTDDFRLLTIRLQRAPPYH